MFITYERPQGGGGIWFIEDDDHKRFYRDKVEFYLEISNASNRGLKSSV